MSNRILEQNNPDGSITEMIEITNLDNSITVTLKAVWDELQAQQDNPIGGTK